MDTIQINGRHRPFVYTWSALKKLSNRMEEKSFQKVLQQLAELPVDHIPHFIFFGLEAGTKRVDAKVDFKVEDVEKWLDDDFSLMMRAFELFNTQFEVEATDEEGNQ